MSPDDKTSRPPANVDARKRPSGGPVAKRPWTAPRVRTGHLFESNSLACGKSTPQLEQCIQNPVTS